jgi:hypothetical protein
VSPELSAAIDAAERLAWMPTANIGGRGGRGAIVYAERREAHADLVSRLSLLPARSSGSAELRALVRSMRRVAACSFSNRWGLPYYERREAVYQLRGCLDVWSRSVEVIALEGVA